MATYRAVHLTFWTDRKVEDMFTAQDKFFYLFLLTNPYSNLCGCYELSIKQMCHYTGYNENETTNLLSRMSNLYRVCKFDEETCEILLLNWHKYNWTKSSKALKCAYLQAKRIKNQEFRDYVMQLLKTYGFEIEEDYNKFAYPINPAVSVSVTDTTLNTDNSISELDTVKDNDSINNVKVCREKQKSSRGKNKEYSEEFETFWTIYPRKVGKGEAFKSFLKAMSENDVELQTLLDGVAMYKKTRQWKKENGAYIPNPSTWLNQKRWEDSPDAGATSGESNDRWEESAQRVMQEINQVKEIEANGYW